MSTETMNRPSAMAIGLAHELYRRFVEGRHKPRDVYDLIDECLNTFAEEKNDAR
jgi:hypothetical protein